MPTHDTRGWLGLLTKQARPEASRCVWAPGRWSVQPGGRGTTGPSLCFIISIIISMHKGRGLFLGPG